MPRGARNPKVAKISLNIDDGINMRLERLADAAGMNKGTMAAVILAAGMNVMERVIYPPSPEDIAEVVARASRKVEQDVEQAVERRDIGFKPKAEDESVWVPSQGYMTGL